MQLENTSAIRHAAILIGGQSRRMGCDKAGLPKPALAASLVPPVDTAADCTTSEPTTSHLSMSAHLSQLVMSLGLQPWIIGTARSPAAWPAHIPLVQDTAGMAGPMAGLHAILRTLQQPVLLLACDLPALRKESLQYLLQQSTEALKGHKLIIMGDRSRDKAGSESNSSESTKHLGLEPCCAIYHHGVVPYIADLQSSGRRALHNITPDRRHTFTWPSSMHDQLMNCNTPDDWQRISLHS